MTVATMTYTLSVDVVSTTLMTSDANPKRYLQREWKRKSSHIHQYSSLPVLRLAPSDRPLFVCDKCTSSNLYVPLCLWCKWTSEAAVNNFENAMPRPRTISAPKFSSDLIARKRENKRRRGGILVGGVAPARESLDSEKSTEPLITPRNSSLAGLGGIPDVESCSYQQVENMLKDPSNPAISIILVDDLNDDHRTGPPEDHCNPQFIYPYPAVAQRPSTTSWIDSRYNETGSGSLLSDGDSRRILQDRTLLRNDIHAPQRHSTASDPVQSTRQRVSARHHGHRPMSTPPCTLRRPPRPLYDYIRTSNASLTSSFHPDSDHLEPEDARSTVTHQSRAAYDYEFTIPTPHALPFSSKGFSVSGETEQRMNLARCQESDYKFYEVKGRRSEKLCDRLKGISRSVKDLFKGSKHL